MLNILLGILKVIGILLAVILSLILFVVLVVLFGPICYRASGKYEDEKAGSAGVSWLWFVLRAKADYTKEAGLQWAVRLFGVMIASNQEEFLKKKEAKRLKKEERQREKAEAERQKAQDVVPNQENKPLLEDKKPDTEKPDTAASIKTPRQKTKKKVSLTLKEKVNKIKNGIHNLIRKIRNIPVRIKTFIENIKAKIARLMELKEFFLGERNREGFLHIIKNLKKMARHILPRRLEGNVEFGVEDPYVMGQILTVLGIFYPVYQDKFTIHPDFENPGFAGNASFKGRIIPGYLLLRCLIVICNKEVRRIIKEGKQLAGGNKS